ncbi:MAG: SMC-Scp complex subunit ScpB [Patescibacteria group bacterium]
MSLEKSQIPITKSQIETILFVASKPVTIRKMAKLLNVEEKIVEEALSMLKKKYPAEESGVVLFQNNDEYQLVSNPDHHAIAEHFIKAEISGELTRPQLETLTVISYCGPITKPELEQIRGVNCSLILRNLLIRGLVKETDVSSTLLPSYEITMEYLQHLGLSDTKELPDYGTLHNHEFIVKTLDGTSS